MKSVLWIFLMISAEVFGAKNPFVIMETSKGKIEIELLKDKAPITVKNFLSYVDNKKYDGTIFHRVIDNFMIQGGGFNSSLNKVPTNKAIKNEADNGLSNEVGTISMARTNVVDSATNQFFINVKDNKFLDHKGKMANVYGYAVFGKVRSGMSIINQIKKTPVERKGQFLKLPKEMIVIKSIRRK